MGIRAFAVGLLLFGVGAGLATGTLREDRLEVTEPAVADAAPGVLPTPAADTHRPQGIPVGARLLGVKRAQAEAKARAAREAARLAAAERASRNKTRTGPAGESPPPAPVDCQKYSGNRRTGCSLLAWAGFDTGQMRCLEPLWDHESGWNERAENPSSGAYGIPQALPASKMASHGADYRSNPVPQIKWGLSYIKGRYQTPCGALAFWENNGWY